MVMQKKKNNKKREVWRIMIVMGMWKLKEAASFEADYVGFGSGDSQVILDIHMKLSEAAVGRWIACE